MKKKAISPVFIFRLYPEPGTSRLFCRVFVWRTRKDMHTHVDDGYGFDGSCTYTEIIDYRKKQGRKKPIFAEMNLSIDTVDHRVLVHEVTHAMFCWMSRRKVTQEHLENMDTEEECCYAHTRMLDRLIARLKQQGIEIKI